MQSLACGRLRVLTKHPKGKDVNETDEFSVNLDFKDEHVKLRINQIQMKETVEENKSTTDRVFVDRQNHVQLVIVRTLKARKTIKHQELVMEVVTQLKNRFKVETTEIKKAIGSLSALYSSQFLLGALILYAVDRDYMERGETKDT
jgi:cullin-4